MTLNDQIKVDYLKLLKYIVLTSIVLYFGSPVLIPLAYGAFVSFVLYPITHWLEMRRFPRPIAITISLLILLLFVGSIIGLLVSQAVSFGRQWPEMQDRFMRSLNDIANYAHIHLGISEPQTDQWVENISNKISNSLFSIASSAVYFSAVSLVKLFLIPVYASFFLAIRGKLLSFICYFFALGKKEEVRTVMHEVIFTFYRFIKGMITVYIIVGTLNSIGLYFLGIPNAILFGFIASILTFIPYIGIIIGSLLPITIAWAVHDNILYGLGVIAVFAFVQFLEANLIFPLAVSYRLSVSTLFTIIAIFVGGILWGVSGMILFIPALGIAKLILGRIPEYRPISVLLEG